jgi:hypothetical protein
MKKLYPFATLLLSIIFSNGAEAQTYSATYTAVRNKPWHVESGLNAWDPNGEPPAHCSNCQVIINSGVTVTLNTTVTLSGASVLKIGTDGSGATALLINSSNATATGFATGFNIILPNDGSSPSNQIVLNDNISMVSATGAGTYDGILTSYTSGSVTTYFKQVGNAPSGFVGDVAVNSGAVAYQTLTGTKTLNGTGTLPIILSGFEARLNSDKVDLSWTTLIEINADYFIIERSTDGGAKWLTLGTVAARGNSSGNASYSYTDANPAAGVAQYRLQMVDLDKKTAYSPIKTVRTGLITGVSIYPNPARDFVNVSVGGNETSSLSIRLLNQSGQLLAEKKVTSAGGTTVSLPVSTYPAGNYLIVVKGTDGSQQVSKLFISK